MLDLARDKFDAQADHLLWAKMDEKRGFHFSENGNVLLLPANWPEVY